MSDAYATEERSRILVVDPSKRNLGVIARRLWEAGYRVTTAESARNAIAELHLAPIDLLLTELDLPAMDGAELTRLIRDEIQWRDLPIMLITGRSEPTGAVRAYEAGADDVIVKPFHFEVLFARIERRLARAQSLQRLRDDNATLDARVVERAIPDRRAQGTAGAPLAIMTALSRHPPSSPEEMADPGSRPG